MIPVGSLIITKRSPSSRITALGSEHYFFDENTGNCVAVDDGTCGLVINNSRESAIGNKVIDILFGDRILSIADYTDQHLNHLWCDVVEKTK